LEEALDLSSDRLQDEMKDQKLRSITIFKKVGKCLLFALADLLKKVVDVTFHNWLFCVFGLDRFRGLKASKLRCETL
jgi:hypothetical protein